mmetsp:Transcript_39835/g.71312  ORF Transcript_39835/g.71312 Transcript_39835/m.71312 type:complete len:226 (+) Transcript_39835:1-678(+)
MGMRGPQARFKLIPRVRTSAQPQRSQSQPPRSVPQKTWRPRQPDELRAIEGLWICDVDTWIRGVQQKRPFLKQVRRNVRLAIEAGPYSTQLGEVRQGGHRAGDCGLLILRLRLRCMDGNQLQQLVGRLVFGRLPILLISPPLQQADGHLDTAWLSCDELNPLVNQQGVKETSEAGILLGHGLHLAKALHDRRKPQVQKEHARDCQPNTILQHKYLLEVRRQDGGH